MQLNAAQPIVDEGGRMLPPMRDQMNRLNNDLPLIGSGSPEGVIEAPLYTLYINRTGTTGTIEYRKMLADVGGDKKQGWMAV